MILYDIRRYCMILDDILDSIRRYERTLDDIGWDWMKLGDIK